jgi:hypothetical protein
MKHCPNDACPHLIRFGRVSEFRDKILRCSDCRTRLVPGDAPLPEPATFHELVTIYSAADAVQAHLVKGVLEAEGIPVHIGGEALLGAIGELPATVLQVTVQVPPPFAAEARELALRCESGRLES